MSSERIKAAAELLRTRAEAISEWNFDDGRLWVVDHDPSDPSGQTAMQVLVGGADEPWATFIATMHPGVALALADWLDATAARIEEIHDSLPFAASLTIASLNVTAGTEAVALADAILGTTTHEGARPLPRHP